MSNKAMWIEGAAASIAANMPDEFPAEFAGFLAELEWEKREAEQSG